MTAWGPPDHHDLHEQPPRVLLVDDAPINLQLLASALGRGYELHVARDGAAALDCIRREPDLDLVLLDIHMPGLDGFEVLTWLREEFPERRLPVIFVTAAGDEQAQTDGFALGAVDYIVRPFSLPVVRARVQTHVALKRQTEHLERLAWLDGLTGAANRRSFDQRLAAEWRRALRNRTPLGLVLFDLDHFKAYNDRHGHPGGDDCLRRIATLGQQSIRRPGDLIARYGGEEFVLLLPDTDLAGAHGLAERLRRRVETCFACSGGDCNVRGAPGPMTLSAGCASRVPGFNEDPMTLILEADRRLYAAKVAGRNRVVATDDTLPAAGGVA